MEKIITILHFLLFLINYCRMNWQVILLRKEMEPWCNTMVIAPILTC